MSRTACKRVDISKHRPAENVPVAPPYLLLPRSLREEWRPGRVWSLSEDGYLMHRVPPVINLTAAQGFLPPWTQPPIHQLCQQTTDNIREHSSETLEGVLFVVVWNIKVIRVILFTLNSMKHSPIGSDLVIFVRKMSSLSQQGQ